VAHPRIAVTMPITNTISPVFMTKPPSSATTQQMSTRFGERRAA
jgi:hypothetical protein